MAGLSQQESDLFAKLSMAARDTVFGAVRFEPGHASDKIKELFCVASEVLKETPNKFREISDLEFREVSWVREPNRNLPPDMSWYAVWESNRKR